MKVLTGMLLLVLMIFVNALPGEDEVDESVYTEEYDPTLPQGEIDPSLLAEIQNAVVPTERRLLRRNLGSKIPLRTAFFLSSTSNDHPASNCIDGNYMSMCHGGSPYGDILIIVMAKKTHVNTIRIVNRLDAGYIEAGYYRIGGAKISAGHKLCHTIRSKKFDYRISCPNVYTDFIVIRLDGNWLNLNEVEVYN